MLFQLHQYTKKALQQWIHKFLLICYSAHLQIDVHCSNHLKKNNLFKPSIKIIQVTIFFFHSFILSHQSLSHHHPQAQFSHQALISLISQPMLQPSPSQPSQPTLISLICQALISLISQPMPSPSPSQPSQPTPSQPLPLPFQAIPAHAILADPLQVSALSSFVVNFLIWVFVVLA